MRLNRLLVAIGAASLFGCASVPAWNDKDRQETRRWFLENIYGVRPSEADHSKVTFTPLCQDRVMMDGAAVRKQVRIVYEGPYGTNSFPVRS